MKHTILGAGGAIGNALTYELLKNKADVRLVSRSNFSIPGTESVKADVSSYTETLKSVQNSDIVYLCVGLEYNIQVWSDLWPKIMKNAIEACKSVGAKLIFFDNVYMYGKVTGKMTEATPYNPCSKKGELRAKIASMLENDIQHKNLDGIIARSADFYGPHATTVSMLYILIIDKLKQGKSAQWMGDIHQPHSFTYTLDCAKGLVMLSSQKDCYNQTWHMPTYNPAPDAKSTIEMIASDLGVTANHMVLKKWMIKTFGLFNKTVAELYEMLYQYEFAYYFDSSKFNNYFSYTPTSYTAGLHETIAFLKAQ